MGVCIFEILKLPCHFYFERVFTMGFFGRRGPTFFSRHSFGPFFCILKFIFSSMAVHLHRSVRAKLFKQGVLEPFGATACPATSLDVKIPWILHTSFEHIFVWPLTNLFYSSIWQNLLLNSKMGLGLQSRGPFENPLFQCFCPRAKFSETFDARAPQILSPIFFPKWPCGCGAEAFWVFMGLIFEPHFRAYCLQFLTPRMCSTELKTQLSSDLHLRIHCNIF